MSGLLISRVDPDDREEFARWHAAYAEACRHDLPAEAGSVWTLEEMRVRFAEDSRARIESAYVGMVGGVVATVGWIQIPLLDNLTQAMPAVATPPSTRRQGHGSAMLAHLEAVARDRGRTLLHAETSWPVDAGPTGRGCPGVEFLAVHDYALGNADIQRELALPVSTEVLDDLRAQAAPHHAAYELRTWVGEVPDELAAGWVALDSTLMTEAPTGDMEREPAAAEVALLHEDEATIRAQGRTRYHCVALDSAEDVVAYTDLVTTVHEPGRAYQWGTLVHREHRGHRLGMAVKVANVQQLQEERPDITRLTTWNAESNAHMVQINEHLGFRPVARSGEFQKRLTR